MQSPTYHVFGDSHSECFLTIQSCKVHSFIASSARGLSNKQSTNGVNAKIADIIRTLPPDVNILFFFGKVDLDFILNYKYNTVADIDLEKYVVSCANLYIQFIFEHHGGRQTFVCELPISHSNDEDMLNILKREDHLSNINKHLSPSDKTKYSTFEKIINFEKRIEYYSIFNKELSRLCNLNNFRFLEINKHILDSEGKVLSKYLRDDKIDHHLRHSIAGLYFSEL